MLLLCRVSEDWVRQIVLLPVLEWRQLFVHCYVTELFLYEDVPQSHSLQHRQVWSSPLSTTRDGYEWLDGRSRYHEVLQCLMHKTISKCGLCWVTSTLPACLCPHVPIDSNLCIPHIGVTTPHHTQPDADTHCDPYEPSLNVVECDVWWRDLQLLTNLIIYIPIADLHENRITSKSELSV